MPRCTCFHSFSLCAWPLQQVATGAILSEGAVSYTSVTVPHQPSSGALSENRHERGKEQTPLPRFKNWKQHSSLYQLLTYDSIDAISSLTSSKAAPTEASVPGLPFYCFMSQHPIACQERDTTQNGQVLQSLEHVELSPVDIHESQHCCEKKQPTVQTILQRQTISYSQNNCYVVLPGLSTWFLTHFWISKMTDLKTIHYCQGKTTSGSSYCRRMMDNMQPILLWHNYGAITDIEGF